MENMPCSPTLVLSGKDSQNSEAQSIVKPVTETPIEDLEVMYQPGLASSTMSERRGVRGENASNMCAPDFGETQDAHEVRIEEEPTELEKKRKQKGKGKMVESPNKGDNRRYVTRGTIQKFLGVALAANEAQTIRNRRQRQLHSVPTEYPISFP
ncbi:hypothetical protein H5410_005218 [Solanum commersonii]|uniref:Uncharacterized protein n=1 Tax=Solanum commersonii TaxID=4109 RepID=A0A9J6A6J8_SOLCO|nr:hypothetical protein H5410_005218 [Solanum commersonii]